MLKQWLIVTLLVTSVGCILAAYRSGWSAGRADLAKQQAENAKRQQNKQAERQQRDERRAAAADDVGRENARTITKEVIKYVKTTDRTKCRFDDHRVSIKRAAADNANAVVGYDAPAVQDDAAER